VKIALDADDQAFVGIEVGDTVLLHHVRNHSLNVVSSDGSAEPYGLASTLKAPTKNCSSTI